MTCPVHRLRLVAVGTGSCSADMLVFWPMPTIMLRCPSVEPLSGTSWARIPQPLAPCVITSLGHLRAASTP
ncbi:Uncharacterised protein [Mycobacterium tuberculosis]|nr:Uncharacterised protein [Mycobacterium tuberculosis]